MSKQCISLALLPLTSSITTTTGNLHWNWPSLKLHWTYFKLHWTYLNASGKHLVNALSKGLIFNGAILYFSQDFVYILAAQSQLMALQTRFEVLQQIGLLLCLNQDWVKCVMVLHNIW